MQFFHFIILLKKCGRYFAALFILFSLSYSTLSASTFSEIHPPTDSLKNKYQLNDPRNPDCPCHLHQKKAEKEFRKQLKKIVKIKPSVNNRLLFTKIKSLKLNIKKKPLNICIRQRKILKKNVAGCPKH